MPQSAKKAFDLSYFLEAVADSLVILRWNRDKQDIVVYSMRVSRLYTNLSSIVLITTSSRCQDFSPFTLSSLYSKIRRLFNIKESNHTTTRKIKLQLCYLNTVIMASKIISIYFFILYKFKIIIDRITLSRVKRGYEIFRQHFLIQCNLKSNFCFVTVFYNSYKKDVQFVK